MYFVRYISSDGRSLFLTSGGSLTLMFDKHVAAFDHPERARAHIKYFCKNNPPYQEYIESFQVVEIPFRVVEDGT